MVIIIVLYYRDGDEWVRLLASVLGSFPNDQEITLDDDSNANDILLRLSEICKTLCFILLVSLFCLVNDSTSLYSAPEELSYLNQTVLDHYIKYNTSKTQHFNLLQRPKTSSQLRNDVLHRGTTTFIIIIIIHFS